MMKKRGDNVKLMPVDPARKKNTHTHTLKAAAHVQCLILHSFGMLRQYYRVAGCELQQPLPQYGAEKLETGCWCTV